MAKPAKFAEIQEHEILQIMDNLIPKSTKLMYCRQRWMFMFQKVSFRIIKTATLQIVSVRVCFTSCYIKISRSLCGYRVRVFL